MDKVLALIDGIYEAGADPSQWLSMMERLADETGGFDAVLGGLSGIRAPVFMAPRTDPEMVRLYTSHYHASNPMQLGARSLPVGQAAFDRDLVDKETFYKTAFYNDWCLPQGLRHGVALTIATTGGWSANLMISANKPFEQDAIEFLQILSPHLTRAFRINQILEESRSDSLNAFSALALVDRGVFVVGENGACEAANEVAEGLLAEADGVRLVQGMLECLLPDDTRLLHRAIYQASTGKAGAASAPISVLRGTFRLPLQLLVIPMPTDSWSQSGRRHRVMVIATNQETRLQQRMEHLRQQFRLTPAETAVLEELARGGDRAVIADRLGVSLATVRTQLTSIFDKTGVRRQGDVIRLVMEQG
ncbi:MAG: helix-turn-helix transcriptional regulator [Alphaproteobacteria bacterium]|nr:helix-turn-helix transcriptional regulator [Alphaproteobacteria bacterium]